MLSPGPQLLVMLSTLTVATCWQSNYHQNFVPIYYGGAVQPVARGSATFLPGPPPPPPPPPPIVLSLVPYAQASRYEASPLPVDRVYSTRGRPALIPTPYVKYTDSINKNLAYPHPNALTSPELGFYGFQRLPDEDFRGTVGERYKAAVGFYGKS